MKFQLFRYYLLLLCSIVFLAQAHAKAPFDSQARLSHGDNGGYSGTLRQQGRMPTDDDWNDNDDWGRFPGQHGDRVVLEEDLSNYYSGKSILPLRQILDLDASYRGYELKKVVMVAQSRAGHAKARLLLDGIQASSKERIGVYSEKIVFEVPAHMATIGVDIKRVQIEMQGNVFVEKVRAILKKKQGPQGPQRPGRGRMIKKDVFRHVSNEILPLRQILDLGREDQGKQIDSIIVEGESRFGYTTLQLLVNGRPVGYPKALGRMNSTVELELGRLDQIGSEVKTLQIQVNGDAFIRTIAAELERSGNGGGHFPPPQSRKLVAQVNRSLLGNGRVALEGVFRGKGNEMVQSVTIIATSQASFANMKICKVEGPRDRFPSCSLTKTVDRHGFALTFSAPYNSTLDELFIMSQGSIFVERIEVELR